MATWLPMPIVGVNAAYEVSPMNGGMALQLSIAIGMSPRGNDTLTMCPVTCRVPPVAVATALASISGPRAPTSPPSEFEASAVAASALGAEESGHGAGA